MILGNELLVSRRSVRVAPDYDDAWFTACAMRAKIIFDIGSQYGDTAMLAILANKGLEKVFLIDAELGFLTVSFENLARNNLNAKAVFVSALITDREQARASGTEGRTIDSLCREYNVYPDFMKIDIEGGEYKALLGSVGLAKRQQTRILVEMHSNINLTMQENAKNVFSWCSSNAYAPWYLKEAVRLEDPVQISGRGRCHLLLQPLEWGYPEWLKGIKQAAVPESVVTQGI